MQQSSDDGVKTEELRVLDALAGSTADGELASAAVTGAAPSVESVAASSAKSSGAAVSGAAVSGVAVSGVAPSAASFAVPAAGSVADDLPESDILLSRAVQFEERKIQFSDNAKAKVISKSKPFNNFLSSKTSLKSLVVLAIGIVVLIASWSKVQFIFLGLTKITSMILYLAMWIVTGTLGWGLLLYPVAIIIVLNLLRVWLNKFSDFSEVKVFESGIELAWSSGLHKNLLWEDITSVFLFRPLDTMLPEKWLVGFGCNMVRPVTVRLPVTNVVGPLLLEALKSNCRWASIDPDLLECWEPETVDSQTRLWLRSLSAAPKEQQLMPLFPGALLKNERYLILSRIGVGGQGTAYLAKDCASEEKEVVVKETLFPVFVDADVRAEARERFDREVELLSQLNHSNIVRMTDSFVDEYRGYLVLDYISGSSLRQLVTQNGAFPEKETVSLGLRMCTILDYLHSLAPAVVHRDFTPENLMLDDQHELFLIDFNVARKLESTKTATVVGKHAYIPPEQFRGDADVRADIYAFGATMFFLLTAENPEPISQSFPKAVNPDLSDELNAIIAKATALEVSERYQSAAEILCDLHALETTVQAVETTVQATETTVQATETTVQPVDTTVQATDTTVQALETTNSNGQEE